MSDQSANSQDSGRQGWHTSPLPANSVSIGTTEIRAKRKIVCRGCGEHVDSHTGACPACGENLAQAPKQIRCLHCNTLASSELVVCPGCGRELREASPKFVTIGVPTVLALLLVVVIVSQWERISPIAWARANLIRGVVVVENLSQSIEPEMLIVMTPIVEEPQAISDGAVALVPSENVPVSGTVADTLITPLPVENSGQQNQQQSILAAAVTRESPVGVGGPETATPVPVEAVAPPTATAWPTNTPFPTATTLPPTSTPANAAPAAQGMVAALNTAEPTPTATPTWTAQAANMTVERSAKSSEASAGIAQSVALAANETPAELEPTATSIVLATPTATATIATTPLPTSTPTPVVYQVRSGDTLVTIASFYDVEVAALMEANQIDDQDIYALQPGQMLYIPLPTPEVALAAADLTLPTPTSTPVVYKVEAGDTLISIASFYDVEVEELMEANQISAQDVFVLQPGQLLNIPLPTPAVEPVAAVASDPSAYRVEAPLLVVPTDDAMIGCTTGGMLIWQRVQFVKDSDHYVLHLGFVNGLKADGQEEMAWVLAQSSPVTQTEWELDTSLCELAPAEYEHQWRWWVEVIEEVDGRTVPVSPPSAMRSFTWQ